MSHLSRFVFAWPAVVAFGLLVFLPPAAGDDPPKKAGLDQFRALHPAERLKVVEKLAGKFATARRGDLTAAVVERGLFEADDYADLICKVKAKEKDGVATAIKWVIDEGTIVKKGERLASLDDSAIRDQLRAATAKVKEAEAALELAAENVRHLRLEDMVEVRLAEVDVKLAEIDLKDAPPGMAREVLELKVQRAKLLLERAVSRAKRNQTQAEAERRAKVAARELEVERLTGVQAELKNCELVAPADGYVVYHAPTGRFGPTVVIAPGEPVREGQKLLRVTALKSFILATRVHESLVPTLRVGQAAKVSIDAFPTLSLNGKVTHVSSVASMPDWQRADVKVYPVTIAIADPPEGLKPNMTGEVQIAIGERKGVVQVPRTAVVTVGRDRICFVRSGQELHERTVVVGASDATSVEIRAGLKEGDVVVADPRELLVRP